MKITAVDALVKTGLAKSKSEARRLIKQRAVVIAYPIYKKNIKTHKEIVTNYELSEINISC